MVTEDGPISRFEICYTKARGLPCGYSHALSQVFYFLQGQRARGLANWNSTGGTIEDMSIKVGGLQTSDPRPSGVIESEVRRYGPLSSWVGYRYRQQY